MMQALVCSVFSPLAKYRSECSKLRALNTVSVLPQVPLSATSSHGRHQTYDREEMLDIYGGKNVLLAWHNTRKTVEEPLQKEACADPASQHTFNDTKSADQTSSWGPAGQPMPIPNTHFVVEVGATKVLMSSDGGKIRIPKQLVPEGVAVGDRLQYQVQADAGSNRSSIKHRACPNSMVTRHLRSADNSRTTCSYHLVAHFPAAVCAERGPRVSTCAEVQGARKHAACAAPQSADSF